MAIIPLVVIVTVLEILVRQKVIPSFLFPAPTEILSIFLHEPSTLFQAALSTLTAATTGFLLSVIVGIGIGIFLSSRKILQKMFYPYISFFQTVPIIAIAPLLVIWFGYGFNTVAISSFIVSVFPMIASTLKGFLSTDLPLVDLFRIHKASEWDTITKLRLPHALPQIFIGAEISAGLAVIGAIVGEFIAGGGLGGLIDTSRTQQRIEMIGASVISASFIGLAFLKIVSKISKIILHSWHPSER